MNEIALINSLKEKVTEQIKSSFAGLIPDEAWAGLVEAETKAFIEKDLKNLINAELVAICKKKLSEELNKPEYNNSLWNSSQKQASTAIKQILLEVAPEMVSAMFGQIAQNVADNMRYNIQNM